MGGQYYLSQSTTNAGRRNAKGLHVAIWEYFSGKKVPKGWIVHHVDENPGNNEYNNLDCVSAKEHRKLHPLSYASYCVSLKKARKAAKAWHRSKAGSAWHSKHAKILWKTKTTVTLNCVQCRKKYETYFPHKSKFCAPYCRNLYYFVTGKRSRR
jgi:hypothetical protein